MPYVAKTQAGTAAAVSWEVFETDSFNLARLDITFSEAPTSAGNVTITKDSVLGAAYDVVLQTISPVGNTSLSLSPQIGFVAGDVLLVEYANPDEVTVSGSAVLDVRQFKAFTGIYAQDGVIRSNAANYMRYYHINSFSLDPGASGATFTRQGVNQRAGYLLNADSEYLTGHTDVHADWDGLTNPTFEVELTVQSDNTGGEDTDKINLQIVVYYSSPTNAIRTQTIAYAAVVGKAAQYSTFRFEIPLDWDAADNVLLKGDGVTYELIVLGTGDLTAAIINSISFFYPTDHVGIESSDT